MFSEVPVNETCKEKDIVSLRKVSTTKDRGLGVSFDFIFYN